MKRKRFKEGSLSNYFNNLSKEYGKKYFSGINVKVDTGFPLFAYDIYSKEISMDYMEFHKLSRKELKAILLHELNHAFFHLKRKKSEGEHDDSFYSKLCPILKNEFGEKTTEVYIKALQTASHSPEQSIKDFYRNFNLIS